MEGGERRSATIEAGSPVVMADGTVVRLPDEVAAALAGGARLCVVQSEKEILAITAEDERAADAAVSTAAGAFAELGLAEDEAILRFFDDAIDRLSDDGVWAIIAAANEQDVASARARGRSVGRLAVDGRARTGMIDGLRMWRALGVRRNEVFETVERERFCVDLVRAPLGVVGFVFEGRPNVVIDACGVLLTGNTVVFRIGRDALGTARQILELVIRPALQSAGLPPGTISLVDNPSRGSGWALFSDTRLSLAVARGSGRAVALLGAIARQNGITVSLHGRGGAWIFAGKGAAGAQLREAVVASLDRKVCNTLNTFCIARADLAEILPSLGGALEEVRRQKGKEVIVHVTDDTRSEVNALASLEAVALSPLTHSEFGKEWEWDENPEITVLVVDSLDAGIELFNRHSPRFVASLLSTDARQHEDFFRRIECPFIGDGMTRWVDGQYALGRPELGLSNWEYGRLVGRNAILSGDSVYTIRARYRAKT